MSWKCCGSAIEGPWKCKHPTDNSHSHRPSTSISPTIHTRLVENRTFNNLRKYLDPPFFRLCHHRPILRIRSSTRGLWDTRKWMFWHVTTRRMEISTLWLLCSLGFTLGKSLGSPHTVPEHSVSTLNTLLRGQSLHTAPRIFNSRFHSAGYFLSPKWQWLWTWHYPLPNRPVYCAITRQLHRTLHTKRYTPKATHCTLYTPRYTLHTTYPTLHTKHCTPHATHCTLHPTLHSAHYTPRYTMHTTNLLLHAEHCSMNTANWTWDTAQYTLHIMHCTLVTAHCLLPNTQYILDSKYWTLHTAHCTLQTKNYTVHTAHCTLARGYGSGLPRRWEHLSLLTLLHCTT